QGNCYEAAFSVWSTQTSFMKGIFWWAWPVPVPMANDLDYNPRNKPAEAVLRRWQGTSDVQAPSAPTNLAVTSKTSTSVSLGWTASTDNVAVVSYQILRG